MSKKQFGGKITSEDLKRYEASPNWKSGAFQNLERAKMDVGLTRVPGLLVKQIKSVKGGSPKSKLPIQKFDKAAFLQDSEEPKFIWYGHAVVLMRWKGLTLLIDPMLGPNAAPIAPGGVKRFSKDTLDLIDDFPDIDVLMMTHDHYDHLDYASMKKLIPKTKKFFVALGVKRHLTEWGVDEDKVTEFDWWDTHSLGELDFHFTPTRHFSGRGLKDRGKSLWGGWAIISEEFKFWFSGDGGYGKHFTEIGKRLGPFDLAFMESGQYAPEWHHIHMFPKESIKAAKEVGVKLAIPFHWAGFRLTYFHKWFESAEDFVEYAKAENQASATPALGELFTASDVSNAPWWEKYK